MSKETTSFIFKGKYQEWLGKNGVNEKSFGAYCPQDKYKGNYLFLDLIGIFAYNEEYLYVNALFEEWKTVIDSKNVNRKTSFNRYSYLYKYKQFIEIKIYGKRKLTNDEKKDLESKCGDLQSIRDSINNSMNPKIDGMDSLISYVNEKQFIKLAIESSYFFSSTLVKKRFKEIHDYICDKKEEDPAFENEGCKYLPARYTQKNENNEDGNHEPNENEGKVYFMCPNTSEGLCVIYQDGARGENTKCNGQICGGGNGNSRVCKLIKDRTGYALGATTDKKHFRNFIISHIWGHAIDPRYFTNLWNVVIVPAWANHLLDKEEEGTLASTFKATIKKVIFKLYKLDENGNYKWEDIKMDCPNYKEDEVFNGNKSYQINIIEGLPEGEKISLGRISKEIVRIID